MSKKKSISKLTVENLFPENSRLLLTGGGKEFIEKIGIEAAKTVVLGILKGDNIRVQTEPLTRRRVALVSNAMISLFTEGWSNNKFFTDELSSLAIKQITESKPTDNASIWPAQWLIGLTGKSVQNVIRGKSEARELYMKEFENAIIEAAKKSLDDFGEPDLHLGFARNGNQPQYSLNWQDLTRLTTAIGCATMTIRGSDKSTYGKLFERLVLGTVLTIMGFELVDGQKNQKINNVFWLSDSSNSRECDATIRFKANKFIRFDIGFIGAGNSEISKDKLTRYASEIKLDSGKFALSKTFIIIDKLPKTSKTLEDAKRSGAEIIQMSMKYWPMELAQHLKKHLKTTVEILSVPEDKLEGFLTQKIASIKIQDFLKGVTASDLDIDSKLSNSTSQIESFEDDDDE